MVHLKLLPAPDFLNFTLPEGHVCLVTADGTELTAQVAEALQGRGWKVVVMRLPDAMVPSQSSLPGGLPAVTLADLTEEHLEKILAEVTAAHGPVAAFIHLNAPRQSNGNGGVDFSEVEKFTVKYVFLAAKHLKVALNTAAQKGRGVFMTVTRLDGEFGLGQAVDFAPVAGGLAGLVKSLNLEWDAVYCRALDLSPDMAPDQAMANIVAELYDPNRLVTEVGYSPRGRVTLVVDQENSTEVVK